MKKHILFSGILCIVFGACIKGKDYVTPVNKLTFEMNGVKYSTASNGNFVKRTGGIDGYLEFNDPVNPEMEIRMYTNDNHCAYRKAVNDYACISDFTTCSLYFVTPPSDPLQVYHYQSGSLTFSTTNCITKNGTDLFTGLPVVYTYCDVSGTFNLTLVNDAGQTIVITNGEFLFHQI